MKKGESQKTKAEGKKKKRRIKKEIKVEKRLEI
jgi:hypothetical protein